MAILEDWTPDLEVKAWADDQGFEKAIELTEGNLRALSKRFKGKPVGLYLWEGEEHQVYVGISNSSVVARLRQHVKNYEAANIQSFRFLPDTGDRASLRSTERQMIHDLCRKNFTCFNREHSSVIYGTSVLDHLVSVEEQRAWFGNPVRLNGPDLSGAHHSEDAVGGRAAAARSKSRFDKLSSHPEFDAIADSLATYLRGCTMFPQRTETHYWSLSCLPQLKLSDGYTRLLTLNMGMLEVFYVNEMPDGKLEVVAATDSTVLPARMTKLALRLKGASMYGQVHETAGPNAEYLRFKSPQAFMSAMESSDKVRSAAARYSLDRMRKGRVSGRFADAHNVLLAQEAMRRAANVVLPSVGLEKAVLANND